MSILSRPGRTPVLYVRLSFSKKAAYSQEKADEKYKRWLRSVAKETRCDLYASIGIDDRERHSHLRVDCRDEDVDRFNHRFWSREQEGRGRFDPRGAWRDLGWPAWELWLEPWDFDKGQGGDIYILGDKKQHRVRGFGACGGRLRSCRKGVCSYRQENEENTGVDTRT